MRRAQLKPYSRKSRVSRSRQIPDGLERLLDWDSKTNEVSMMGKERRTKQRALRWKVVCDKVGWSFLRTRCFIWFEQTTYTGKKNTTILLPKSPVHEVYTCTCVRRNLQVCAYVFYDNGSRVMKDVLLAGFWVVVSRGPW